MEFKLYKERRIFVLRVNGIVVETLQNSLMTDCDMINYFRNSITSYSNFNPSLTVMF